MKCILCGRAPVAQPAPQQRRNAPALVNPHDWRSVGDGRACCPECWPAWCSGERQQEDDEIAAGTWGKSRGASRW